MYVCLYSRERNKQLRMYLTALNNMYVHHIAECAKPDDNYRQHLHNNFSPSTAPLKPFISNIHQLIFYYIFLDFASAAILYGT